MTTSTSSLTIDILGRAAPKGSKRCVGGRGKVKHRLVEMSPLLPAWTESAVLSARARVNLAHWVTLTGPCTVEIWVYFTRPKSVTRPYPSTRHEGDIDKIARGLLDPITVAGVIADDSLVVDLNVHARYAIGQCGARIVVTSIEETT